MLEDFWKLPVLQRRNRKWQVWLKIIHMIGGYLLNSEGDASFKPRSTYNFRRFSMHLSNLPITDERKMRTTFTPQSHGGRWADGIRRLYRARLKAYSGNTHEAKAEFGTYEQFLLWLGSKLYWYVRQNSRSSTLVKIHEWNSAWQITLFEFIDSWLRHLVRTPIRVRA